MNRLRIALGVAAGGLVGAAFVPVAVALADNYDIVADPSSTETITGLYGLENTSLPDLAGSIQGYQEFEVVDTTTGNVVGTFDADEANLADGFDDTNQQLLVTSDVSGSVGTAPGDTPPVGSVFDTFSYGNIDSSYVYSDLASKTPGGDVISETSATPFGDTPSYTSFDAAAGLAADTVDTNIPAVDLGGGYEIVPDSASAEQFTAISGLPPYDVAVQGTQQFEVVNSAGAVVGSFDGDVTSTQDGIGFTTQAVLVTSDVSGTVGTAAGDTPAIGSIFNVIDLANGVYVDDYSDLTSTTPGADVISNGSVTALGNSPIFTTFDASAAESPDATIPVGNGYEVVADPNSTELFTGVNGLPPFDVSVQGYQLFDLVNSAGTPVGSFDADVTTSSDIYGISTETLHVTSDVTGTSGTAAGDIPPVGSELDVSTLGDSGIETVYSDLASTTTGADVISDTIVTPFGDFALPNTFDAAAGLAADMFSVP